MVEGGPAALAGVAAGHVIVAVDGKPWTALTLTALRNALSGTPGRKVRLRMQAGGERVVSLNDLV